MTGFEGEKVMLLVPAAALAGAAACLVSRKSPLLVLASLAGLALAASSEGLLLVIAGVEIATLGTLAAACPNRLDHRRHGWMVMGPWAMSAISILAGSVALSLTAPFPADPGLPWSPAEFTRAAGLGAVVAGLVLRIGAVPFSALQAGLLGNARPQVAGYAATAIPAAAFIALVKIAGRELPGALGGLAPLLAACALLTTAAGSLIATHLRNLGRMIAWVCVAQTGFLLLALSAAKDGGTGLESSRQVAACLSLLMANGFALAGIYSVVSAFPFDRGNPDTLEDYAALSRSHPALAAAAALFLLSLAGFPPLGGFVARSQILTSALAGRSAVLVAATSAAVLASIPLLYCASRVIAYMYLREPKSERPAAEVTASSAAVIAVCAAGVIATGVAPNLLRDAMAWLAGAVPV